MSCHVSDKFVFNESCFELLGLLLLLSVCESPELLGFYCHPLLGLVSIIFQAGGVYRKVDRKTMHKVFNEWKTVIG